MLFTETQTASLLAVKGVGKTVLQRLQQMGLDDVAKLAAADPPIFCNKAYCLRVQAAGKTARKPKPPLSPPWSGRGRSSKTVRQPENGKCFSGCH